MDEPSRCRGCGKPRPSDAPAGLCPVCLLKAGQADSGLSCELDRLELTVSLAPARSSAFANLAESLGGLPRILLIDTDPGEDASPLIKPRSPEMPAASDRTDRYQLFGEIAHGGMGAVLRGRDVDIGRDLAVKVLLDGHAGNPDLVRRFIEEAQIGGQLQHPGVVPIYDVGTFADRRPFFTMKLVKGRTLAGLLQARKDPTDSMPRFLGIFEQVCQTIAYAHARGVIHRDLKPSNIMVGSFGEVQVMDWGLAKVFVGVEWRMTPRPVRESRKRRSSPQPGADRPTTSHRPVACWGHRLTWPPSRRGARATGWMSESTCSRWARSSVRCSPASPHSRGEAPPRFGARRRGARWPRRSRDWRAAGPNPS